MEATLHAFALATSGFVLLTAVGLTLANVLTYWFLAPWHETRPGRWVMGLLFILLLLIGITGVRLVVGDFPYRYEILYFGFLLYIASMIYLLATIVHEQYRGAMGARKLRKQAKKEQSHG